MKSILSGLILVLALLSSSVVAQSNTEDSKIMNRLNAGAYSGPYHKGDDKGPLVIVQDKQDYYKIDDYAVLNPDWIENAYVLKEQSAEDVFGESGSNGVIIFTLKKDDKAARKYFKTIKKNKINI